MHRARARSRIALGLLLAALAAGGARAAEPAGDTLTPDRWHLGSLDLRPCTVGARGGSGLPTEAAYCTTLDVPEDWEAPAGRHIGLHLALVRSTGADADPDLVVFLDGGPGGAATEDYPAMAPALAPLRKRHHILLVDQRGTGASNPLDCEDDLTLEGDKPDRRAVPPAPGDAAAQQAATRRCLAALAPRAAPQFYATTDAVRDLEAVRQALGGRALDLVGVSYGTRVAQQYSVRYPQAVRSIVLDSPVPNRVALLSEHARNLEAALQQRLALCGATPACAQRYGDSAAVLRAVLERLRRQPQTVQLPDPRSDEPRPQRLGADDLAQLLRFYLYSDTTSALVPLVIAQAHGGQYAAVLAQSRIVVGDVAEHLSNGMAASVLCTEDADLLQDQPQDAATLLGAGLVSVARATCALWPHRGRPAGFHEPLRTDVPLLVLSGQFDPVTPQQYGAEIVARLPHARQLLAPGQGHAVLGVGCMPKLVAAFVRDRDPARLDDRCLAALGAAPAFLDVNGARP